MATIRRNGKVIRVPPAPTNAGDANLIRFKLLEVQGRNLGDRSAARAAERAYLEQLSHQNHIHELESRVHGLKERRHAIAAEEKVESEIAEDHARKTLHRLSGEEAMAESLKHEIHDATRILQQELEAIGTDIHAQPAVLSRLLRDVVGRVEGRLVHEAEGARAPGAAEEVPEGIHAAARAAREAIEEEEDERGFITPTLLKEEDIGLPVGAPGFVAAEIPRVVPAARVGPFPRVPKGEMLDAIERVPGAWPAGWPSKARAKEGPARGGIDNETVKSVFMSLPAEERTVPWAPRYTPPRRQAPGTGAKRR